MKKSLVLICIFSVFTVFNAHSVEAVSKQSVVSKLNDKGDFQVSRTAYLNKLEGFWLGQCIANWTGLVTEMDKIGGEGIHGQFTLARTGADQTGRVFGGRGSQVICHLP